MIDYSKIQKEARLKKISPYIIVKRKLNYRKAKLNEAGCKYCKYMHYIKYKCSIENVMQCKIIGETINESANVTSKHICNAYKKY